MKTNTRTLLSCLGACVVIGFLLTAATLAQGQQRTRYHTWPDDLVIITVTGTVQVDANPAHPIYYLDTNADGAADYHLSFGPWWYEPDGGAARPDDGETVTVTGAVLESPGILTLLVFELDGVTWRMPVEYGATGWNADPCWDQQGELITVTGTALVDDTYFYEHDYLDVDGDGLPEYKLGLGPPWYEPASGAVRPEDGQTITVYGRLHALDGIDLLTVYALDGLVWRPLDEPAPWAGQWINRSHPDTAFAFCANNADSWIAFPPGHMGHGGGQAPWPDSMFTQCWRIHPDSLPGPQPGPHFGGFFVDAHDPQGNGLMRGQFGGRHARMRFQEEHQLRFQYYDEDLAAQHRSEDNVGVQYWDDDGQQWIDVADAVVDRAANTITVTSADLNSYYALTAPGGSTAVEEPASGEVPTEITLFQNYPNPFNPVTAIPYALTTPQHVVLRVYDVLGREVATLVDAVQAAGRHQVAFDARSLPSGVYVYTLRTANTTNVRYLMLAK